MLRNILTSIRILKAIEIYNRENFCKMQNSRDDKIFIIKKIIINNKFYKNYKIF